MAGRDVVSIVENGKFVVFERREVERHAKQQHTEGPDVGLVIDHLLGVHVDHFGCSCHQCCVPLDLLVAALHLCRVLGKHRRGRGTAKVAELVEAIATDQHVFNFEIAVYDWRRLPVQVGHCFAHRLEDFEHSALRETELAGVVDEVDESASAREFKDEIQIGFCGAWLKQLPCKQTHDVLVRRQRLHDFQLTLGLWEIVVVGDIDSLECVLGCWLLLVKMQAWQVVVVVVMPTGRFPRKIDECKSSLGYFLHDGQCHVLHLNGAAGEIFAASSSFLIALFCAGRCAGGRS